MHYSACVVILVCIFVSFSFKLIHLDVMNLLFLPLVIDQNPLFVQNSLILLNSLMANPFQVVQRKLVIFWNEESIDVSRESVVQINDSPVHVNKDDVDVKQAHVDKQEEYVNEHSLDYPDCSLPVSFGIEVIKLEKISGVPISLCAINYSNKKKVKDSRDAIPNKYF